MIASYTLQLTKNELNTIYVSLRNVQKFHNDCIDKGISVMDHKKLLEKQNKLMEEMEDLIW